MRRDEQIIEDGKVLATTPHRHVLSPGDSLEGQDSRVAAVATATWTPENVRAWSDEFISLIEAEQARKQAAHDAAMAADRERAAELGAVLSNA